MKMVPSKLNLVFSILIVLSLVLVTATSSIVFAGAFNETIYSDTSVMVYGPLDAYAPVGDAAWGSNPVPAVPAFNPGWPTLDPASWISNTFTTEGNIVGNTWRLFRKTVNLCTGAYDISGMINVNSDNAEEAYVNGVLLGSDGEVQGPFVDDHEWNTVQSYAYNIAAADTLTFDFIVRNYAVGAGALKNPTGLIFNATISYNCPTDSTPTITPTSTFTYTPTPTDTLPNTSTYTPVPTYTLTNTPNSTNTSTKTPAPTYTPSNTPPSTNAPTNTPTPTYVLSNTPTNTPASFEGCTPGYWKQPQHLDSWIITGYSPGQSLESVFNIPDNYGLDNDTLLQALNFGGGAGTTASVRILLRAAVSGLLNSSNQELSYPFTTSQVIAQVNTALATNNRNTILDLATKLDTYNNLGCPLN